MSSPLDGSMEISDTLPGGKSTVLFVNVPIVLTQSDAKHQKLDAYAPEKLSYRLLNQSLSK
jgi:hypothetical protein